MTRKRGVKTGHNTAMSVKDIHACRQVEIAAAFDVSTVTVRTAWAARSMPRDSKTGTYDLPEVIAWHTARAAVERVDNAPLGERSALEVDKLRTENEILQARLAKLRGETIPRVEAEQLAQSQAIAMRVYLTDSWKIRGLEICKALGVPVRDVQKLYKVFDDLIEQSINTFCEKAETID